MTELVWQKTNKTLSKMSKEHQRKKRHSLFVLANLPVTFNNVTKLWSKMN